jgi:hypothetical protein
MIFVIGLAAVSMFQSLFMARKAHSALLQWSRSEDWPTTPGVILHSELKSASVESRGKWFHSPLRIAFVYHPEIRYRFEVAGTAYQGSRLKWCERFPNPSDAAGELVDHYAEGQDVLVHYDPGQPEQAVLDHGFNLDMLKLIAGSALFFLFGLGILLQELR